MSSSSARHTLPVLLPLAVRMARLVEALPVLRIDDGVGGGGFAVEHRNAP